MDISRTTFRKPLLASTLALAGLGLAGQAGAASVAYSTIQLLDFQFSATNSTVTPDNNARVTSSSATFTGYPSATSSHNVTSPATSDVALQATGPSIGGLAQNDFDQLLTGGGFEGARGDAYTVTTSGVSTVQNVGEAVINSFGNASVGSAYNANAATIAVASGGSSFTMSFDALIRRYASTELFGDSARSSTSASFTLTDNTTTYNFAPSQLNSNVSASGVGITVDQDTDYDLGGSGQFFTWNETLTEGTWYLSLYISDSATASREVPEPATISLLGASLVGLAAARRRKSKVQVQESIPA